MRVVPRRPCFAGCGRRHAGAARRRARGRRRQRRTHRRCSRERCDVPKRDIAIVTGERVAHETHPRRRHDAAQVLKPASPSSVDPKDAVCPGRINGVGRNQLMAGAGRLSDRQRGSRCDVRWPRAEARQRAARHQRAAKRVSRRLRGPHRLRRLRG